MKTEQKPPTLQPSPREPLTFNDLVEPGASTSGNFRWLRGHCSITGSGSFRAAVNVDDANFNTIAVVPFSK